MTRILALDSSTEQLALSLSRPEGRLIYEGQGGAQASESMLPEAMQLLRQAGLDLAQLDAIAFGQGPGAFTGLRTACAVAQGLGLGANKPVLALDSLMLVAEDARLQGADCAQPLWVAMDARMAEIYAGAYRFDGSTWHTETAPALYTVAALQLLWQAQPPRGVAGNGLALLPAGSLTPEATTSWPQMSSRALALASLAEQAWAQGLALPADEAQPLYVRDKVAQTTAERLAARSTV